MICSKGRGRKVCAVIYLKTVRKYTSFRSEDGKGECQITEGNKLGHVFTDICLGVRVGNQNIPARQGIFSHQLNIHCRKFQGMKVEILGFCLSDKQCIPNKC